MRWVQTNGGPFILLPWEKRAEWEGADPPSNGRVVKATFRWNDQKDASDYDEACDHDDAGLIRRDDFDALAIPMLPKTWIPRPRGGILVHWDSGPSTKEVEAMLRKSFGPRVRKEPVKWKATKLRIRAPKGKLVLFDAAYPGKQAPSNMRLVITLPRGNYAMSTCDWQPNTHTLMILRRFTKTK